MFGNISFAVTDSWWLFYLVFFLMFFSSFLWQALIVSNISFVDSDVWLDLFFFDRL